LHQTFSTAVDKQHDDSINTHLMRAMLALYRAFIFWVISYCEPY